MRESERELTVVLVLVAVVVPVKMVVVGAVVTSVVGPRNSSDQIGAITIEAMVMKQWKFKPTNIQADGNGGCNGGGGGGLHCGSFRAP